MRWAGVDVVERADCVQLIQPELSWVDEVISWNPCNERKEMISQPTAFYIPSANVIVAHPAVIYELKRSARSTGRNELNRNLLRLGFPL